MKKKTRIRRKNKDEDTMVGDSFIYNKNSWKWGKK